MLLYKEYIDTYSLSHELKKSRVKSLVYLLLLHEYHSKNIKIMDVMLKVNMQYQNLYAIFHIWAMRGILRKVGKGIYQITTAFEEEEAKKAAEGHFKEMEGK